METITGYCVKCKAKKEITDAERVTMPSKGGKTRPAAKGTCPDCKTGVFKILPADKPEATA